jgi:hypothetical protein
LVVLVVALILGNGLLYLTRGHNPQTRRQAVLERRAKAVQQPKAVVLEKPAEKPARADPESSQLFESKLKVLDELTRMAHGRLDDLEKNIRQAKPTVLASESDQVSKEVANLWEDNAKGLEELKSQSVQLFGDINEKIGKLDNFRANTVIELKGIKEVAVNMKGALKTFQPELIKKAEDNLSLIESELDLIKSNLNALQKERDRQDLLSELDGVQSRLDKLHTFKTNTEVELKALKEIVLGLKGVVERSLTEKGEAWAKSDGKAKNFDQYMEKFRRVSLGMKNMDY